MVFIGDVSKLHGVYQLKAGGTTRLIIGIESGGILPSTPTWLAGNMIELVGWPAMRLINRRYTKLLMVETS